MTAELHWRRKGNSLNWKTSILSIHFSFDLFSWMQVPVVQIYILCGLHILKPEWIGAELIGKIVAKFLILYTVFRLLYGAVLCQNHWVLNLFSLERKFLRERSSNRGWVTHKRCTISANSFYFLLTPLYYLNTLLLSSLVTTLNWKPITSQSLIIVNLFLPEEMFLRDRGWVRVKMPFASYIRCICSSKAQDFTQKVTRLRNKSSNFEYVELDTGSMVTSLSLHW